MLIFYSEGYINVTSLGSYMYMCMYVWSLFLDNEYSSTFAGKKNMWFQKQDRLNLNYAILWQLNLLTRQILSFLTSYLAIAMLHTYIGYIV